MIVQSSAAIGLSHVLRLAHDAAERAFLAFACRGLQTPPVSLCLTETRICRSNQKSTTL
jgi:hypothetical protein